MYLSSPLICDKISRTADGTVRRNLGAMELDEYLAERKIRPHPVANDAFDGRSFAEDSRRYLDRFQDVNYFYQYPVCNQIV